MDRKFKFFQHSASDSASVFCLRPNILQVFGLRLRPNVKIHLRSFSTSGYPGAGSGHHHHQLTLSLINIFYGANFDDYGIPGCGVFKGGIQN